MHFLIQTIVKNPCEPGTMKKLTISSLRNANACQTFTRTQYIALPDVQQ